MVAKFNGKQNVKKGSTKPAGKPVKHAEKKIQSAYSKAKSRGGSAYAGSS